MEPVACAALRALFGLTILSHGYPKMFRTSHGGTPDAYLAVVRAIRDRVGLPAPEFFGMLVTGVEFFGALMLVVGLATRIVAPMVAIMMVVIAVGVHWPVWAWSDHGMEYPVLMAGLAGAIAVRGGGRYSVDHMIGREV